MPKLEAFAGEGGDEWEEYVEVLEQHFIAHNVSAAKQRAVFLSSCGRSTYSLLRRLLAPRRPSEVPLDESLRLQGTERRRSDEGFRCGTAEAGGPVLFRIRIRQQSQRPASPWDSRRRHAKASAGGARADLRPGCPNCCKYGGGGQGGEAYDWPDGGISHTPGIKVRRDSRRVSSVRWAAPRVVVQVP